MKGFAMFSVWRVEHPLTGKGPYRNNLTERLKAGKITQEYFDEIELLSDTIRDAHAGDYNRPGVYTDICVVKLNGGMGVEYSENMNLWQIPNHDEFVCGVFADYDLLEWFSGFWDKLEALGYVVVFYRATFIAQGEKQIAFNKDDAIRQETYTIKEFLKRFNHV